MNAVTTGGNAFHAMLSEVDIDTQLSALKKEIQGTKSPSKRDVMVKQIKYLDSLKRMDIRPEDAYVLHHMPVIPPICRPPMQMPGNRIEYADANVLYKEHQLANEGLRGVKDDLPDDMLMNERAALYDGAKAVMGVGDALSGSSRGKGIRGFLKQIGGESGPKTGYFQSKILSHKLDFSGRATIYAEPDTGFNEAKIPSEMLWTMYAFHIIRDLVKNGYTYPEAKKAVELRTGPAKSSFAKMTKLIPVIINRAPTLMASNLTAFYPIPVSGQTIGLNPIHLPNFSADFDGDCVSVHCPQGQEAIDETRKKLLPEHHIFDSRKGIGVSLLAPGHEAILGSIALTSPDTEQKVVKFKTESEALQALKDGTIKANTPIQISA